MAKEVTEPPRERTRRETHDMPLMAREAPVATVNVESRTVEMVWTTGAAVQRYDWMRERYFLEELSLDPKHVRMGRLQSGAAPLLNTHARWDLASVLGVVTEASLGKGEGRATVKFSDRDDVKPIFKDVQDGIIRNVSVGYSVYRFEMIPPKNDGELWRYRAIDWEPSEVSLVPIGADADAGTRASGASGADARKFRAAPCEFVSDEEPCLTPPAAAGSTEEERVMTEEERKAAEAAEAKRKAEADAERKRIAEEAAKAERERIAGIREAVVTLGGLDEAFAQRLIAEPAMTAADAGLAVLREKAKRSAADPGRGSGHIDIARDEVDTRRSAMAGAILLRMNPRVQLSEQERETSRGFRHMSLLRLSEESLQLAGVNTRGMAPMDIAGRALHTTSDLPAVLANVANKRLRQSYQENTGSYQRWARRAPNAPDFKPMQVTQLSAAPDLQKVAEGGEFKYGSFSDGKETYAVATYGRIIAMSRQMLVNDDLRALDRMITGFASSAARLENRIVYGILTANAALGNDSTALFHANHGNLAGSGGAISATTLGAGRTAMRLQKGKQGEELNVIPAFLIAPATQEQVAYQYTSANYVPAKQTDTNEFRAGGRTAVEPIIEPVLDGNSTTAWYLASSSDAVDTIEYCWLEGSEGVWIETELGFDIDGMKMKARDDFAAKAIDFVGLYKNPGA